VQARETAIGTYTDGWNARAQPMTWTQNTGKIIAHANPPPNRKKTYHTRQ